MYKRLKCAECHHGWAHTSEKTFDVNLPDEAGLTNFNPPSLLGIGQLPRLFHDHSAANLREVFTRHRHPAGDPIPPKDLDDLLAFLLSL